MANTSNYQGRSENPQVPNGKGGLQSATGTYCLRRRERANREHSETGESENLEKSSSQSHGFPAVKHRARLVVVGFMSAKQVIEVSHPGVLKWLLRQHHPTPGFFCRLRLSLKSHPYRHPSRTILPHHHLEYHQSFVISFKLSRFPGFNQLGLEFRGADRILTIKRSMPERLMNGDVDRLSFLLFKLNLVLSKISASINGMMLKLSQPARPYSRFE